MRRRPGSLFGLLLPWLLALTLGCAAGTPRGGQSATPPPAPTAPAAPADIATSVASATPRPRLLDIRASRLVIPSLNIDARVQSSRVALDTSTPAPGCPARPPGEETFTVPDQGIATPERAIEGLEYRAWIFGHSRWQNQPGLFFGLQDLNPGDELFVDGLDRRTDEPIVRRRFVVDGLYLTDIDSGGALVAANTPTRPVVILQTSVREDGPNRQWLLNAEKVLAKSRNMVEGDMNDPCKYLLLFVFAQAS